jgi:autotransporter adhesin
MRHLKRNNLYAAILLSMTASAVHAETGITITGVALGTGAAVQPFPVAIGDYLDPPTNAQTVVGHEDGVAIGTGAQAIQGVVYDVDEDDDGVVDNTLYSPGSTAIGVNAQALEERAVAVGSDASASYGYSTAVGTSASGDGWGATAVGNGAYAGDHAVAIGNQSQAAANFGTAAGSQAVAIGENSTALGAFAEASGDYSIALGGSSVADEAYTVGVGGSRSEWNGTEFEDVAFTRRITGVSDGVNANDAVNVSQLDATLVEAKAYTDAAVGGPVADPNGPVEIGGGVVTRPYAAGDAFYDSEDRFVGDATGGNLIGEVTDVRPGIAIGLGAQAYNGYATTAEIDGHFVAAPSIAIGENAIAEGGGSVVIGADATAIGTSENDGAVVVGTRATASDYATAVGHAAEASGTGTLALGNETTARGDWATSIGSFRADASGNNAVALGAYTSASGDYSTALGPQATATGFGSVALGYRTVADEDHTVAVGDRRIVGLADGTAETDAVNLRQLQAGIDQAFAYTDAVFAGLTPSAPPPVDPVDPVDPTPLPLPEPVVIDDREYVDARDAATLASAQTYADEGDVRTLASAQTYADEGDVRTLASAQTYADEGDARTLTAAKSYADGLENRAFERSQAYTDKRVSEMETTLSSGIAAVAASPMLPALGPGESAIAVGAGHFNGSSALGVMFGHQPSANVNVFGGVSGSFDSGSEPVYRAGASFRWK